MSLQSSKIAALNDALRAGILDRNVKKADINGCVLLTDGIASLPIATKITILTEVRLFDSFDDDNDPHGERDFGAFDNPAVGRVFWKIDYYNADMTGGSPDPADPEITRRVLTIMRATEY